VLNILHVDYFGVAVVVPSIFASVHGTDSFHQEEAGEVLTKKMRRNQDQVCHWVCEKDRSKVQSRMNEDNE
jgi:hypothetical protein